MSMAASGWLCQDQLGCHCVPHQQCLMGLTSTVYQHCLVSLTTSLSWTKPAVSRGPHQQCRIQMCIWHSLGWRCLARCIQWLLQQLLQQSGVAKGQPRQPMAEGGDALLQATCCGGQVGSDAW